MTGHIDPQAFWAWAYSDFLSNSLRGVLAEFIVAQAIGAAPAPRTEWDAYDLLTPDGRKVEVKSAAYLQTWAQARPSVIRFDIAPKRGWDARTNVLSDVVGRSADLYVFCLFTTLERERADPLDLSQWAFMTCLAGLLNERFGAQKTASLAALRGIGLQPLNFAELCRAVQAAPSP